MRHSKSLVLAGSVVAGLSLTGQALAVKAYASVHLNIRSGPGEQFPIVGEMRWNSHGEVDGCTADYAWCHISTANGVGWASAHYLIENKLENTFEKLGAQSGVPVVVPEAVTVVGAVTRVPAGSALVEAITPSGDVIAYVSAQPVAPVHVTGEIVVGVVLPVEVTLYEVPNAPYHYAAVNALTVLVEPNSRKVVYIVR